MHTKCACDAFLFPKYRAHVLFMYLYVLKIGYITFGFSRSVRITLRQRHSFRPELNFRRSQLHRLRFRRLCGQLEIYNWILFQIWQWSNLVEVKTSGVHSHLNDRSRLCSCVRRIKRSFMARSAGAHVLTSRLRLGPSCLQRQSSCCFFDEKYGSPQCLQAYRRSISLRSGFRHCRENRFRENIHNR